MARGPRANTGFRPDPKYHRSNRLDEDCSNTHTLRLLFSIQRIRMIADFCNDGQTQAFELLLMVQHTHASVAIQYQTETEVRGLFQPRANTGFRSAPEDHRSDRWDEHCSNTRFGCYSIPNRNGGPRTISTTCKHMLSICSCRSSFGSMGRTLLQHTLRLLFRRSADYSTIPLHISQ